MTAREIVEKWLKENKCDGLWNPDDDCACKLDDLMPCFEPWDSCKPGYLREPTPEEAEEGFTFFIGPEKEGGGCE